VRESSRGKLPLCFSGGLIEENCQCGVVCALRVKNATLLYGCWRGGGIGGLL